MNVRPCLLVNYANSLIRISVVIVSKPMFFVGLRFTKTSGVDDLTITLIC